MSGWRGRRWAVWTSVAGTVFIAAGAFWLSFTALADLAHRSGIGAGQAWAWPLIVDGVIVVSTVAVVALAGERTAWYPWALLIGGAAVSVTANSLHAVVADDPDVPDLLAAAVAAVPPIVLLAITHLTVVLTHTTADVTAAEQAAPEPTIEPAADAVPPVLDVPDEPAPTRRLEPEPESVPDPEHQSAAPEPAGISVSARRVRAAGLRKDGWSNKKIARAMGVHPSTVGRWFAGAYQPDEEHGDTSPEPVTEGAMP